MRKKILLTLKDDQLAVLEEMMKEDLAVNRTAFFVALIVAEHKRRQEIRNKRGVGRPRKVEDEYEAEPEPDYTNDLPKVHIHMGSKVGPRELADIERRHRELKGL